jgi:hypothetical protein
MYARRPTGEGAPGCGNADLAIAARVSAAGLIWLSIAFWSNERSIAGFSGLCAFAPSAAAAEITWWLRGNMGAVGLPGAEQSAPARRGSGRRRAPRRGAAGCHRRWWATGCTSKTILSCGIGAIETSS